MGQLLSPSWALKAGIRPFKPKYAFNPTKMVKTAVAQDIEPVMYPEEPSVEVETVHYNEDQSKLMDSPASTTTSSVGNVKKNYRDNLKITSRTINRV